MEIAYFTSEIEFPAPHAGYVHADELTKNMSELGINVTVYAKPPPKCDLSHEERESNRIVKYVRFPFLTRTLPRDLLYLPYSYKKIKDEMGVYDLIHERFIAPNPWMPMILKRRRIPHILEVNSPFLEEFNILRRMISRRNRKRQFNACDAIITQTKTLRRILVGFTDKPVFVIPNGVDPYKFSPNKKEEVRERYASEDEILITFIGAFMEWHGVHRIPEIARKIDREDVKFLLVGGGRMYDEVKRVSGEKIILTGPMEYDSIPPILASSDILIAPFDTSKFDALKKYGFWWCPVKLFEYMSAGRPIVSYDFEEVRNIVRDAGLLAKPGDLEQFVQYLCILIEDEDLRSKLGNRGREIAESEYSWRNRAKDTIMVYEEILSSQKP
jgi:glycosyltransferase involved in cell wall biosynthesis